MRVYCSRENENSIMSAWHVYVWQLSLPQLCLNWPTLTCNVFIVYHTRPPPPNNTIKCIYFDGVGYQWIYKIEVTKVMRVLFVWNAMRVKPDWTEKMDFLTYLIIPWVYNKFSLSIHGPKGLRTDGCGEGPVMFPDRVSGSGYTLKSRHKAWHSDSLSTNEVAL